MHIFHLFPDGSRLQLFLLLNICQCFDHVLELGIISANTFGFIPDGSDFLDELNRLSEKLGDRGRTTDPSKNFRLACTTRVSVSVLCDWVI